MKNEHELTLVENNNRPLRLPTQDVGWKFAYINEVIDVALQRGLQVTSEDIRVMYFSLGLSDTMQI